MTKIGIMGATGYGGVELVRLLLPHPKAEITALGSVSFEGQNFSSVYPSFIGMVDQKLVNEEQVIADAQVIFAALPHGLSQQLAAKVSREGKIFIDLGGDFRLAEESEYKKWYGCDFLDKDLQSTAVYGLTELFREEIRSAKLVANPGCYPTGAALGLAPIVKTLPFITDSIIIDAKSGVTGAGRSPSDTTHFPAINENCYPYKIGQHRHTPEIAQTLSRLAGRAVSPIFTPHLIAVNRGILSTIYISLEVPITSSDLFQLYKQFYQNDRFVRILKPGATAQLLGVTYSNYCDISLHLNEGGTRVIIVTAIDNMVKGAAGQAIQNMNLICGYSEDTGLIAPPPAF